MVFILRSINHSRQNFLPTYIALRMLLSQIPESVAENYLIGILRRNALSGQAQSYKRHLLYKNTSDKGEMVYRNASAASPTALLLETYCLTLLARDRAFENPSSTYSYNWSSPQSSSIWTYFHKGWSRRETAIKTALDQTPNGRVILLDVKSFYPSANGKRCREQFANKLKASEFSKTDRRILEFVVEQTVQEGGNSIPVGPPLGHALANIFLADVDTFLNARYPGAYFRYVDDIAIVVQQERTKATLEEARGVLAKSGLSLNDNKTNIVDAKEWNLSLDKKAKIRDLGKLRSMIVANLAIDPSSQPQIERRFEDKGFNLPISEMAYTSKSGGFVRYLARALKRAGHLALPLAYRSADGLVSYASALRTELKDRLDEDLNSSLENFPYAEARRRRRIRNEVARLTYMFPLTGKNHLLAALQEQAGSDDLQTLLKACSSGDITELLSYPGPTVRTFAQLWSNGTGSKATVRWNRRIQQQQRDAMAGLLLWKVIDAPQEGIKSNPSDLSLFDFCAGRAAKKREVEDLSYMDEIRSLQIGSTKTSISHFLKDRFDEDQMPYIEGLAIAGKYS